VEEHGERCACAQLFENGIERGLGVGQRGQDKDFHAFGNGGIGDRERAGERDRRAVMRREVFEKERLDFGEVLPAGHLDVEVFA